MFASQEINDPIHVKVYVYTTIISLSIQFLQEHFIHCVILHQNFINPYR